jgi:hypothetical protein
VLESPRSIEIARLNAWRSFRAPPCQASEFYFTRNRGAGAGE